MARFAELAMLAEELAGEAGRLKKRAAIATALAAVAGRPAGLSTALSTPASKERSPGAPVRSGRDDNLVGERKASGRDDGVPGGLKEAGLFCLYLAGQPFAEADPRKLNVGGALLSRAVKEISGCTDAELAVAYRRHGDLGAAAYDLLAAGALPVADVGGLRAGDGVHPTHRAKGRAMNGAPGGLSLGEVAEAFATLAGARTTVARAAVVEGLLRRASALEAKYLLKLMLGDMRIGVKQSLIEEAIAVAASEPMSQKRDIHPSEHLRSPGTPDMRQSTSVAEMTAAVRHAVMLEADLARAAEMAFAGTLAEARMRLFHPLGFMLASPVETPEEAVERFTEKPKKVAKEMKDARRLKKKVEAERGMGGSDPTHEDERAVLMNGAPSLLPVDAAEERYARDVEMVAGELRVSPLRSTMGPLTSGRDDRSVAGAVEGQSAAAAVEAYLEDKYDGMRAQVHCGDSEQPGRVAIYSRNREDITQSFPEIEEALSGVSAAGVGPLILDGELLGWSFAPNGDEGKALPFSVLGQRIGRKRVSNEMRRQIPVVFMAFDLLFQDGELLLARPLRERRARLEAVVDKLRDVAVAGIEPEQQSRNGQWNLFAAPMESEPSAARAAQTGEDDKDGLKPVPFQAASDLGRRPVQRLMLSPAVMVESAEAIDRAYAEARARANEGVMLKAAGSAYLPGRRGLAWVKLKRELATLDVVITGAEFGHGRRAGLLSDYTFAVRGAGSGDKADELLNVGKAYSGVTDAEIAELTKWLKAHTVEDYGHFRTVEALRVIEVAFNNVMRSDRHASGFALRFPRILRIREDKPVEEIDTLERVEAIYQGQPDKPRVQGSGE